MTGPRFKDDDSRAITDKPQGREGGFKVKEGMVSRREFLRVASVGAAGVLLAACAPKVVEKEVTRVVKETVVVEKPVEKEVPAKAPVTVEFLAWLDPADKPAYEALAKIWNEQNADIQVRLTIPADNFYEKLQTMIAGGVPPDLAQFQTWEWQPFADKEILVPLDEYINRDDHTAPFPDTPAMDKMTKRHGNTWIVPYEHPTMVMFYLKKPFDEAGIPYPTGDWTLEEFLETAEKLTDTSGDTKKFGYQANGNWFRDIQWIRSTGKQEFDTLVDPHKVQFNQPEIVEIVQTIAYDMYHTLKISPTPADLEGGANTIQTGNTAMKYEGPWFFSRINSPELREKGKALDFDMALMPKVSAHTYYRALTSGHCLLKGEHVEESWRFLYWATGEEGEKIFCGINGRVPNSFDLIENFWGPMVEEKFGVSNYRVVVDALKYADVDVIGGIPRRTMWNEVVKPVGWDPMIGETAKAEEVLPEVDKKLQAILDEYWEEQAGG